MIFFLEKSCKLQQKPKTVQPKWRITEVPHNQIREQSRGHSRDNNWDRSINLVSGTQIQTLITLQGWGPRGLCITSSGNLLVIMKSDDGKQTKVVRYSGSTEKRSIQLADRDMPLYACSGIKYLSENRNLDICVASSSGGYRGWQIPL